MAAMVQVVESTLAGMGYELVEAQASNHGRLLRIFIDRREAGAPGSAAGITLEDCAAVSRHLAHVFAVEGIDYDRLEISSPGLDRRLRKAEDFVRFAGHKVDIRMRQADATGRRRFVGLLQGVEGGAATVKVDGQTLALDLDGMARARLVPNV